MEREIKNIIFDLGGVLLNVDYLAPVREFEKLGITGFEDMYSKAQQSNLFNNLETGKIPPAEFRDAIREISEQPLTDAQIDHAWNSILLDLPQERVDFLYALRKKYRLFLLSNTNAIHIKSFEQTLKKQFGKNIFDEIFEHHYYSSDLGLRKPDTAIFEKVMQLNGLFAGDTLFIDDSPQHIEGARKTGMHVLWLDVKKTDIVQALSGFL